MTGPVGLMMIMRPSSLMVDAVSTNFGGSKQRMNVIKSQMRCLSSPVPGGLLTYLPLVDLLFRGKVIIYPSRQDRPYLITLWLIGCKLFFVQIIEAQRLFDILIA